MLIKYTNPVQLKVKIEDVTTFTIQGHIVRDEAMIQLKVTNSVSVTEVNFFDKQNIALGIPATQSSNYSFPQILNTNTVDGNTNGINKIVTHTNSNTQPW